MSCSETQRCLVRTENTVERIKTMRRRKSKVCNVVVVSDKKQLSYEGWLGLEAEARMATRVVNDIFNCSTRCM
jgi:hypothetical protein